MRISTVFYFYAVIGLLVALTVFGVFSYRRDIAQFEEDMTRDAQILGRALSAAAGAIWSEIDEESAREMIANSAAGESQIEIRWITPQDSTMNTGSPWARLDEPTSWAQGFTVAIRDANDPTAGLYTYVRLRGPSEEVAALELYEPWTQLTLFARLNATTLAWMASSLVVFGGVFFGALGHWSIGRRVTALRRHTIDIADGNLETRVEIGGHDELTDLGRALNQMATQLEYSKQELLAEHESHLKTVEQLRHADRVSTLGRLSAGMAHELGTPLNVIAGRAKLIGQAEKISGAVLDSARTIVAQADRITSIVRTFLDFGRRSQLRRTLQEVREPVQQAVRMLTPLARANQVDLELKGNAIVPQLMLDSAQVQQVFTNIITNAIHAMPSGGNVEIVIDQEKADGISGVGTSLDRPSTQHCVTVRVEDKGIGMSAVELAQVFEPFFTTKPVGQGTGMGLSIAAGIVEDHGGWISARSEPGSGSCFVVHLPVECNS